MRGNFYYKKLGESIARARHRKGLSQQQLAILAESDRSYLAEVEIGKANPSMKYLYKIAKILKVKVGELTRDL